MYLSHARAPTHARAEREGRALKTEIVPPRCLVCETPQAARRALRRRHDADEEDAGHAQDVQHDVEQHYVEHEQLPRLAPGPGCRAMTFVHTRTGATAAAPPQQQAWPHALRMQDAPWQAWSHACACRTLPGKLGHMPSHAGRSLGQAWSHAAAYRTLPDRASLGHRQSGLIRKQASNMKQNAKLMLFRFNPWSSSAGGSPYISVQCMCKQILHMSQPAPTILLCAHHLKTANAPFT